ncbi:MAG: dihydroneopterin aldolase [Firmicutes bacterium]|nr:dihydroneopterin aldolase [Bacillota bacterium]
MYSDYTHKDKIMLPELEFTACHGMLPHEHTEPQVFRLAVTLVVDTAWAAESDDIADTVNYAEVYGQIEKIMLGRHHNLLESLAAEIAGAILENEMVQQVTVRLEKVAAPVAGGIRAVLEIERTAADYGI